MLFRADDEEGSVYRDSRFGKYKHICKSEFWYIEVYQFIEQCSGLWKSSGVCYSGSLLLVVLSHSKLSSLWVGDARGVPGGCMRSPWKRLHSGQMRMWLQPRATIAASCASLWESGSDSPVPAHNLPLLRLVLVGRARLSSAGKGCERRALGPLLRLRRSCRLSWHSTMPCSSRSISSHTDN